MGDHTGDSMRPEANAAIIRMRCLLLTIAHSVKAYSIQNPLPAQYLDLYHFLRL